jgi:hypothetical protein
MNQRIFTFHVRSARFRTLEGKVVGAKCTVFVYSGIVEAHAPSCGTGTINIF